MTLVNSQERRNGPTEKNRSMLPSPRSLPVTPGIRHHLQETEDPLDCTRSPGPSPSPRATHPSDVPSRSPPLPSRALWVPDSKLPSPNQQVHFQGPNGLASVLPRENPRASGHPGKPQGWHGGAVLGVQVGSARVDASIRASEHRGSHAARSLAGKTPDWGGAQGPSPGGQQSIGSNLPGRE